MSKKVVTYRALHTIYLGGNKFLRAGTVFLPGEIKNKSHKKKIEAAFKDGALKKIELLQNPEDEEAGIFEEEDINEVEGPNEGVEDEPEEEEEEEEEENLNPDPTPVEKDTNTTPEEGVEDGSEEIGDVPHIGVQRKKALNEKSIFTAKQLKNRLQEVKEIFANDFEKVEKYLFEKF